LAKIILSGYYGCKNLGDEAILAGILHSLRKLNNNLEITVLSGEPSLTEKRYEVNSVYRQDYKKIIRVISDSELFISGGGSLLQNVTGWKSIPYYLGLTLIAQLYGKKTVFYAQGIGPVNSFIWPKVIKRVADNTDLITVRDKDSRSFLKNIGVEQPPIKITADPVFAFTGENFKKNADYDFNYDFFTEFENMIGVCLKPWNNNQYLSKMVKAVNDFAQEINAFVVIIPFHFNQDQKISRNFAKQLTIPCRVINDYFSPRKMLAFFNKLDLVIGVRLHSLMFSALKFVPFIALSYDPKIDAFLDSFDLNKPVPVDKIKPKRLYKTIKNIWYNKEEFYDQKLTKKVEQLHKLTLENAEMVNDLLKY